MICNDIEKVERIRPNFPKEKADLKTNNYYFMSVSVTTYTMSDAWPLDLVKRSNIRLECECTYFGQNPSITFF